MVEICPKAIHLLWVEVGPDQRPMEEEKENNCHRYLGHAWCRGVEYKPPFTDPSMRRGKREKKWPSEQKKKHIFCCDCLRHESTSHSLFMMTSLDVVVFLCLVEILFVKIKFFLLKLNFIEKFKFAFIVKL
jgi:hypothetical protein